MFVNTDKVLVGYRKFYLFMDVVRNGCLDEEEKCHHYLQHCLAQLNSYFP